MNRRGRRRLAETKLTRLGAEAPDLADLVRAEWLTIGEAWAVFEQRVRDARRPKEPSEVDILRRRYGVDFSAEQLKEYEEFVKRRDAFNALLRAEQVEMARFVWRDPELAFQVRDGIKPLFEAFHELKKAEAFLE
jgi:hypothetical protein